MIIFNTSKELENSRAKYKRYCKCGHSIVFPYTSKTNKTICTWCGNAIYKNDFEKFKENFNKKTKELKNG